MTSETVDGLGAVSGPPLRARQVSEQTGIAVGTLRYWRHRGEGPPSYKLGGSVVYDRAELASWLAAQRERTGSLKGAATA